MITSHRKLNKKTFQFFMFKKEKTNYILFEGLTSNPKYCSNTVNRGSQISHNMSSKYLYLSIKSKKSSDIM